MQRVNHMDPRLQQALEALGADEHVKRIVEDAKIGRGGTAIDLEKVTQHRQKEVATFDHPHLRGELFEVKGHLVYRLEIKGKGTPESRDFVGGTVIPKGLGSTWDRDKVEHWLEENDAGKQDVWTVWVKEKRLDGATRGLFVEAIPRKWEAALASRT